MLLDIGEVVFTLKSYPVALHEWMFQANESPFSTLRGLEVNRLFLGKVICAPLLFVMLCFDVLATYFMWRTQAKRGEISIPWDRILLLFTLLYAIFTMLYVIFIAAEQKDELMFWMLQVLFIFSICYKSLSLLVPDKNIDPVLVDVDSMAQEWND
jgi:hypothetical protein